MIRLLLIFAFLLGVNSIRANDGAFFAMGNQLIPIQETDISVKKEILTLKKIRNQFVEVTVYYEFFNPGPDKTITVGFEAFSPEGDVDGAPINGRHPYMRDFTVELNDAILKYDVAYVTDAQYAKNGKINSIDLENFNGNKSGNEVDFYYVYHFQAKFKKGLNIIKHTYNYDLSGSVDLAYEFEYVLTAAKRWANKQIDDFTLILDMGEFETFAVNKTFFKNSNELLINGIGKAVEIKGNQQTLVDKDATEFHIQKGNLIFQKKDFKVNVDLYLYSKNYFGSEDFSYLPFSYYKEENIEAPKNQFERKVLKNLPFARRGYIFKTQDLNKFFQGIDWYIPNPNYEPNIDILSEQEKQWIKKWE